MITAIVFLFLLGLCFGSFISALTWRLHEKKDWVKGRSQCIHCGHKLSATDLVPLFSWLALSGRCRYCKKPISWQYPAVELGMGLVFAASYAFWPGDLGDSGELLLLITWLATSVGLMALLVYDFRFMLLPNKIIYPTLLVAAAGRLFYILGFEPDKIQAFASWGLGVVVASGIFWLIFMVSKGKWIGYGDVRLGLVTGTILASPSLGLLMIFIASLLGTFFALPAIISGRRKVSARVPYGPFLIVATMICVLFGESIIVWYNSLFLT